MSVELVSVIGLLAVVALAAILFLLPRRRGVPEVVVYAVPDIQRSAVINLVIKNKGKSAAYDVRFDSNKKIPARAFGLDDAPDPGFMTDGPLIDGIASFGPGDKHVITWGQYGGLKKGLGDGVLEVTAIFFNKPPSAGGRQEHAVKSRVDLSLFQGREGRERAR